MARELLPSARVSKAQIARHAPVKELSRRVRPQVADVPSPKLIRLGGERSVVRFCTTSPPPLCLRPASASWIPCSCMYCQKATCEDIQTSVFQSMERELSRGERSQLLGKPPVRQRQHALRTSESVVRRRIAAAWSWITVGIRLPPFKRPQSHVKCGCCSRAAQTLSCCLMECRQAQRPCGDRDVLCGALLVEPHGALFL